MDKTCKTCKYFHGGDGLGQCAVNKFNVYAENTCAYWGTDEVVAPKQVSKPTPPAPAPRKIVDTPAPAKVVGKPTPKVVDKPVKIEEAKDPEKAKD